MVQSIVDIGDYLCVSNLASSSFRILCLPIKRQRIERVHIIAQRCRATLSTTTGTKSRSRLTLVEAPHGSHSCACKVLPFLTQAHILNGTTGSKLNIIVNVWLKPSFQ